ncbi:hypothetical protein AJ79_08371 [Helicocarpus griseus UAMH5409]|uniref:NDT80 domain-containing protein n=1 Tax=Helicocarpus griseus UAMH5409 TaxID=1447875 RepID=A0A2B7WTD3_9EURO|nr:hypothetical protein AJ79_08371 [Helicocarpus griseus UAMH5409]
MESFDTMAMPYLGSPLSMANLQNTDYLNAMPSLDIPDTHSSYDHETFVSGEDIGFAQPPMPAHPMRRYSNTHFDDHFPEIMPPYEALPSDQQQQQQQPQQQDSSIDHNHKLLSFSIPMYNFTLLDYSLRRTSISMAAQLHGMFFLAESPWTTSPTTKPAGPPPMAELTCYRRNLFQITGSVTLPRTMRYIMTEQGDRIPILAQELTVSATESVEGNPVKIISVPWKTPAANATGQPEDKTEKEPPSIPLDIMGGHDLDSDYATFSIAWKRLQFRIATANNGRRKELQQHFVVRLKIVATLSTGAKISICEAHSGPVIVRGRSPRNFQSRKDLPLSGSAASSRKHAQANANRASASEAASSQQGTGTKRSKSPQNTQPDQDDKQQQPPSSSYPDWQPPPATSAPLSTPTFTNANANDATTTYSQSSPEVPQHREKRRRVSATGQPISLSFVDDDSSPGASTGNTNGTTPAAQIPNNQSSQRQREADGSPPAKAQKRSAAPTKRQPLLHNRNSSGNVITFSQPQHHQPSFPSPQILNSSESADLLYEYFPLGLDDWQAPVDAVYRPHVVHHTNLPDDPKAIAAKSRSRTYFVEGS